MLHVHERDARASRGSFEFSEYNSLGRLQVNIPPLPTQNLDNLDDILNQLINFYKLE